MVEFIVILMRVILFLYTTTQLLYAVIIAEVMKDEKTVVVCGAVLSSDNKAGCQPIDNP